MQLSKIMGYAAKAAVGYGIYRVARPHVKSGISFVQRTYHNAKKSFDKPNEKQLKNKKFEKNYLEKKLLY